MVDAAAKGQCIQLLNVRTSKDPQGRASAPVVHIVLDGVPVGD
jgi:hypothetical protein